MSTTIRISDETKSRIDRLAAQAGLQIQTLVDRAIADYERASFFDQMNAQFALLRADPEEWRSLIREREQLTGALADWTSTDTTS